MRDPLQAKVGATVRCTLTDGTGSFGVTLTVRAVGENVDFHIAVDPEPLADGEGS